MNLDPSDRRSRGRRWFQSLSQAGVLFPATLTGYLWLKGLHPALPGWGCPLRALTGIPCPTCFLTRAVSAALIGDLPASLHWHAFGPPLALGLLLWSGLAIQRGRFLPLTIRGRSLASLAVAMLLYWIGRMILQFGLHVPAFPQTG
ncbi:MAG: DUF2752 domain-containing protein [Cyanobium sp.]